MIFSLSSTKLKRSKNSVSWLNTKSAKIANAKRKEKQQRKHETINNLIIGDFLELNKKMRFKKVNCDLYFRMQEKKLPPWLMT